MNEPILGKADPHGWDNKPITWGEFLKIRKSAQKTADAFGYPVYLVGSSLHKEIPRDIDISVIMPLKDYEKMFGKLPVNQEGYSIYLRDVFNNSFEYTKYLVCCDIQHHFDVKVCPDTWWIKKDKMLLAEPKINKELKGD